ncbi:MAG: VOC family protein [Rhodobacter sp.]|nr:VOC family protein [Rhodobacter sp.]
MSAVLDHVQLAIPRGGEEASRAFWQGLLGWDEIEKPRALASRGGLWIALDGSELHLGVEEPFVPARKAHPGFRVAAIDDLAHRLTARGHSVTWDDAIAGRKRFFTEDPFGNRLEFLET